MRLSTWLTLPEKLRLPAMVVTILWLAETLLTLVWFPQLPPVVPLFYTLPLLSQHLVNRNWVWMFPILISLIVLLHFGLINRFRHYQPLLLQLFAWTTVVVVALLSLTVFRSMLLVL